MVISRVMRVLRKNIRKIVSVITVSVMLMQSTPAVFVRAATEDPTVFGVGDVRLEPGDTVPTVTVHATSTIDNLDQICFDLLFTPQNGVSTISASYCADIPGDTKDADIVANDVVNSLYMARFGTSMPTVVPEDVSANSSSPAGTYSFEYWVTDTGSRTSSHQTTNVTIVDPAPVSYITSPMDGAYVHGTVDITGWIDDNADGVINGTSSYGPEHYWLVVRNLSGTTVAGPGTVNVPPPGFPLNGSNHDAVLYTWSTATQPDGQYTIIFASRDSEDNRSQDTVVSVTVDNTLPQTSFTSPADNDLSNMPFQLVGNSTDNFGVQTVTLEYSVSGADDWHSIATLNANGDADYDWTYTWTPPADGVYDVKAYATDLAGNTEHTAYVTGLTYDTTPPAVPTGLRRIAPNEGGRIYTCGSYSKIQRMWPDWDDNTEDDFNHYEYTSFNAPYGAIGLHQRVFTNSIFQYNGTWMPQEGTYGFAVRAVDDAGNASAWALGGTETLADSCQITYDDTPPSGTIDAIKYAGGTIEPTKFMTNASMPTIVGTATDDNAVGSVSLSVNGHTYPATVSGNSWEATVTDVIPEGTNTMTLTVSDQAGNTTTVTKSIFIDTHAPTAVYRQWDGTQEVTGTVPYVNDLARLSFTAEYTDTRPSSGLYWDSYVIFEAQDDGSFNFSQNGKRAFCGWRRAPNLVTLSGSSVYSLTTPQPFNNCVATLPDGEYYMTHQVYDTATRQDIPSINQFRDVLGLHFFMDATPPTIDEIPDQSFTEGQSVNLGLLDGLGVYDNMGLADINIHVSYTDPVGMTHTRDYSRDIHTIGTGGTLNDLYPLIVNTILGPFGVTVTTPVNFADHNAIVDTSIVPEGSYTFTYYVTDQAGNRSSTHEVNITVTNEPPVVVLDGDTTIDEGDTATFTGSFTDPSSNFNTAFGGLLDDHMMDDSPWTASVDYGDGAGWEILGTHMVPETVESMSHTYDNAGTYTVSLRVCEFDDTVMSTWPLRVATAVTGDGECTTVSRQLTVNDVVPTVSITADPRLTVDEGTAVTLTAVGSGGNAPLTYAWSGDCSGNTTSVTMPTVAGTYTCDVTVTDADGDTATDSATVTVNASSDTGDVLGATHDPDGTTGDNGSADTASQSDNQGEVLGTTGRDLRPVVLLAVLALVLSAGYVVRRKRLSAEK